MTLVAALGLKRQNATLMCHRQCSTKIYCLAGIDQTKRRKVGYSSSSEFYRRMHFADVDYLLCFSKK